MLLTDEEDEALLAREDKVTNVRCSQNPENSPLFIRFKFKCVTECKQSQMIKTLSQTDMTEELLPDWESVDGRREWEDRQTWPREEKKEKTREQQHTTWEQWSLWDQFGSTGEIIQVCDHS